MSGRAVIMAKTNRVLDVDADGRDREFARSDMLQNDKSYGVAHEWHRGYTVVLRKYDASL